MLNCSSTLNAETTSPAIMDNRRRTVMLRPFLDVVCCSANQEIPFRSHNESSISLNKGNFMEFLNALKKL